MYGVALIIGFLIRLLGAYVCSSKATSLNRNSSLWGALGFISPILFMIWIQFMKPKIKWDKGE